MVNIKSLITYAILIESEAKRLGVSKELTITILEKTWKK